MAEHMALAFGLLSANTTLLAAINPAHESRHLIYVIRLAAFVVIIVAIIDKNRDYLREWVIQLLGTLAARVRGARDGWDLMVLLCRCIARGEAVDLVVTDMRMPRASGFDVLEAARACGVRTPFLLVTGASSPELAEKAAALGARVLDKPFAAAALRARVAELCRMPGDGGRGPFLA